MPDSKTRRPLKIGDALAYGRSNMDCVMREILATEGVRQFSHCEHC